LVAYTEALIDGEGDSDVDSGYDSDASEKPTKKSSAPLKRARFAAVAESDSESDAPVKLRTKKSPAPKRSARVAAAADSDSESDAPVKLITKKSPSKKSARVAAAADSDSESDAPVEPASEKRAKAGSGGHLATLQSYEGFVQLLA
jgi:hypothetical protein